MASPPYPARVLLEPRGLEVAALLAVGLAVLALAVAAVAVTRLRHLRRAVDRLAPAAEEPSAVGPPEDRRYAGEASSADVQRLREDLSAVRADLSDALRHVAVVRYDAFGDRGGLLSFSVALLDDAGDGLVLTSINGRSETRTYAKGVEGGSSGHPLSPEEQQAIARAGRAAEPRARPARPRPVRRDRT